MLSISLGLRDRANEFCSILPCFGSADYVHEVLPLRLAINPQVWITYIESYFTWFEAFSQKVPAFHDSWNIMYT